MDEGNGTEHEHERLAAEISARLRSVCGHLSDEDFRMLVSGMARVAQRFREIEADPALRRPVDQPPREVASLPPIEGARVSSGSEPRAR